MIKSRVATIQAVLDKFSKQTFYLNPVLTVYGKIRADALFYYMTTPHGHMPGFNNGFVY